MIDFAAAALACKRANAAYVIDREASQSAFGALGDTWIGQYANASHQAVLSVDAAGETHLSISGTRASALKVLDVLADMDITPAPVLGGNVTQGVFEGMAGLWQWVLHTVPAGDRVNVAGHSLGASRTHLTPLFLPAAQTGALHSFEAPKFADGPYYAAHADALAGMVCVLNGGDLWAAYPWKNPEWCARPLPLHVWLKGNAGEFSMIPGTQWPGGTNADDHDVSLVQARLEAIAAALAAAEVEPAA